jgi:NADH:quinone reductase (non-electrogenic)
LFFGWKSMLIGCNLAGGVACGFWWSVRQIASHRFKERKMGDRPRVVIVGCGFAGLGAVHQLRNAPVDVTLVDKNDYHTFQPLLYQVATAELDASTVGYPIRDVLHKYDNLCFHKAAVTGVDLDKKQVQAEGIEPLAYDYLVVGLGALVNFFGVPGAAEHAMPLYTLEHAVRLKKHLLAMLEAADKNPALIDQGTLNVVIVGAGPTGVETAGALTDLFSIDFAEDYPNLPIDKFRIILVDGGPNVLHPFKEKLQDYTHKTLEKLGVELRLGEHVVEVTDKSATLKSGDVIETQTLIWAGGLHANPLAESLGKELDRGGRVPVGPDLSLPGHPEAFAAGDIAQMTDAKTGKVLPQRGSVALQAGTHAGTNVARLVAGKSTEPFAYHDKGTMATIGRGSAVAELPRGVELTGEVAWLMWGAVHLALLTGAESRASVMVDWTWSLFTHDRGKRIDIDS